MSLRPRPSIRELPGDLLTPVGAYLRIRDLGPGFLLESIERGQQVGRYSFLGAGCEAVDARPRRGRSVRAAAGVPGTRTPTAARRDGMPPFVGRHRRPPRLRRDPPLRADGAAARAAAGRRAEPVALPAGAGRGRVRPRPPARPRDRAAGLGGDRRRDHRASQRTRRRPQPAGAAAGGGRRAARRGDPRALPRDGRARPRSTSSPATCSRSCRPSATSARRPRTPAAIYRALRAVNPSPYMFFLETDGLAVVGASPEMHVSLTADGTAALRPIAGTRAARRRRPAPTTRWRPSCAATRRSAPST